MGFCVFIDLDVLLWNLNILFIFFGHPFLPFPGKCEKCSVRQNVSSDHAYKPLLHFISYVVSHVFGLDDHGCMAYSYRVRVLLLAFRWVNIFLSHDIGALLCTHPLCSACGTRIDEVRML